MARDGKKKKEKLFSGSIKPNTTNVHTVQSSLSVHTVFKNKHVIDKVKKCSCAVPTAVIGKGESKARLYMAQTNLNWLL